LILFGFIFAGCPGSAWEQVRDSENIDELREYVQLNPKDIHVSDALNKIAYLEKQRAVAADTRYAYRMFLERHPDSVHAFEIKRRLEHLDFFEIQRQGTLETVLDFLRTWPNGTYASQARKMADRLKCKRMLKSEDADALTAFLTMHPDISCHSDLLAREVKLLHQRAVSSGSVAKLIEFIHAHPAAEAAKEARSMLANRRVEALIRAARFKTAQEVVRKHAFSSQHAALTKQIEESRLEWVRSSLDPALIRKSAASFDLESKKQLRRWAARISARRRTYRKLAEATAVLRRPLVEQSIGDTTLVDPRLRWLDAKRLALSPEEDTAEFLLDLLGDSFLQVRKVALESLKLVVASLGKVRAEIWLSSKKAQLVPKATTGILLCKVAALYELSGQPEQALKLLEDEAQSQENPDPFSLFHAARLAVRLGQKNRAATLTDRLSRALTGFFQQRTQAWEGLRDSERGWLTLRQIYGARALWQEALSPYSPGGLPAAEDLLGNWLERSRADLKTLEAWFEEEERKWTLNHNEYTPCRTPDQVIAAPGEHAAVERDAVSLLSAFISLAEARRTLAWTACCHPRRSTRRLAAILPKITGFLLSVPP
jgi:hypothetical protein